jgi:hypothetical protein
LLSIALSDHYNLNQQKTAIDESRTEG